MKGIKGAGYVYILQNRAFASYVVKIGFSSREPDVRAREIYHGSTGVPMPFDVAMAYSVGACERAEKEIHSALKAYRLNKSREFFRVPPQVAASVVLSECAKVNKSMGIAAPAEYAIKEKSSRKNGEQEATDIPFQVRAISVPLSLLRASPTGTSVLTVEQERRVAILSQIFFQVYPDACEKWTEDFSRDLNPDNEIIIWENMAKAFLTIDELYMAGDDLKKEAFWLLLQRSWCSTDELLKKADLKYFSLGQARRFLGEYKLKPKPLVVSTNPPGSHNSN